MTSPGSVMLPVLVFGRLIQGFGAGVVPALRRGRAARSLPAMKFLAAQLAVDLAEAVPAPPTPPATPTANPGYVEREWGDGTASPVYVPVVERIDDALADEVDDRLVRWGEQCGFRGEELDQLRKAGFGRLAMLTHTDTEDPEQLLIAARLNAAWPRVEITGEGLRPAQSGRPRLFAVQVSADQIAFGIRIE